MSDVAFEALRNTSIEIDFGSRTEEQNADMGELSMDELDEANGGLMIPLLFAAGFFGYLGYHHMRYCR